MGTVKCQSAEVSPHQISTKVIAGFRVHGKKAIYGFVQTLVYESL